MGWCDLPDPIRDEDIYPTRWSCPVCGKPIVGVLGRGRSLICRDCRVDLGGPVKR